MNRPVKLPPHLVLTAILSGGITTALSLIYILLSIVYFVYRTKCDVGTTTNVTGAEFFWRTVFNVFIMSNKCTDEKLEIDNLTDESTMFILMTLTMIISVLCLVAAISLITIVQEETRSPYLKIAIISYIGCCIASLIIDLTTASHFGVDYSYLTSLLRILTSGAEWIYLIDVMRQGAFWLMTIAMKGYVVHLINCVLVILLVTYYQGFEKYSKTVQHSIHKLGALNAFEQRKKTEEIWSKPEMYNNNSSSSMGPYMNSVFVEDDMPSRTSTRQEPPRPDFRPKPYMNNVFVEDDVPSRTSTRQEPSRSDYRSNNSFDRSNSWHHSQGHSAPGSRPFSYLEDIKRPAPSRPPPSPADAPWHVNQWAQNQVPSVPAPDYSPTQPRRLKSALKSPYM